MLKRTFQLAAVPAAFALILAGCGGEDAETQPVSGEENSSGTEATSSEGTYTVKHHLGEAEIPENPEKVVVLSHVSWEGSLLSVGVQPHAVMAYDNEWPPHLTEELQETEALPYTEEINPEEMLALDPDLLIISDRYAPLYEQLSDTIPTVVVEIGGDWKEDHLLVTEAVGKKEEGQQVIDDLQAKAEDIGQRIKEEVGDETFMGVAINREDIRVYGTKDHAVNTLLYEDIGLTPAEGLPEEFGENVSIEGLAKYNPDHIIDLTFFNSGEYYESVKDSEVWNGLNAVQNDQVHTISTTWGFWDPIEREKGLEEIENLLLRE
ncbi:ABC transporter substrate-binding protein [Jeotgalibacillus aurantiacus]|uniref:ABC transporter substrate-binding protein n=1 Tax=Jeotgalibacillus aurantiacus TaxID=2763266 RepID=UPI001D0B2EA4|nr:ABC transporter substrate-binding protein [Jeotgalibacillus aurantiacus]